MALANCLSFYIKALYNYVLSGELSCMGTVPVNIKAMKLVVGWLVVLGTAL